MTISWWISNGFTHDVGKFIASARPVSGYEICDWAIEWSIKKTKHLKLAVSTTLCHLDWNNGLSGKQSILYGSDWVCVGLYSKFGNTHKFTVQHQDNPVNQLSIDPSLTIRKHSIQSCYVGLWGPSQLPFARTVFWVFENHYFRHRINSSFQPKNTKIQFFKWKEILTGPKNETHYHYHLYPYINYCLCVTLKTVCKHWLLNFPKAIFFLLLQLYFSKVEANFYQTTSSIEFY